MVVHPRDCESTLNSLTGFPEPGGRSQEQLLSLPQGCWDPRTWALAFSAPKPQAGTWVKSGASRTQGGTHVDASAQAEAQPAWPTWPWFLGYLKGCVWVVVALGSTLCLFDFRYLDAHICLKIYIDYKKSILLCSHTLLAILLSVLGPSETFLHEGRVESTRNEMTHGMNFLMEQIGFCEVKSIPGRTRTFNKIKWKKSLCKSPFTSLYFFFL